MKNAQEKIKFHFLVNSFYFPKRNHLKAFLLQQLTKEKEKVEAINFIFCNDEYLVQMDKQYLNHNTLTDIITFELSQKGEALIADIYISIERVRENAKDFKTTFSNELLRVIFHGVLHLTGLKDKSEDEKTKMRHEEETYLRMYSVSRRTVSP